MINLTKDTKHMLKGILLKFIEKQAFKAVVKATILQEFEIASMKKKVMRKEVHEYVSETLRYPYGHTLTNMVKECLREMQVADSKARGYRYFFGLQKKNT